MIRILLLLGIALLTSSCSEEQTEFKYLCKNLVYPNPYTAILEINTKNETTDFMLLYEDGSTYNSNIKYDRNFINNEYRFSAKSKFGDEMSFNKLTSKLIFNRIDEDSDLRLICDKQA